MEATGNPSIRLYKLISARSDEATAIEVVTVLEEMVNKNVKSKTNQLAIKSDLYEWRTDGRKEIVEAFADVRKEIAEFKTDIIEWMFLFWIGQIVITFGSILLFLKK